MFKLAYCDTCGDLSEFELCKQQIMEDFKGEHICYPFVIGKCIHCGNEVATDIDYNTRKSKAKLEAYKEKIGIITINDIQEILNKYDIKKETLSIIAGFGTVTVKRYFCGYIPSKKYSDILFKILNDEEFFITKVQEHKNNLTEYVYNKIMIRYNKIQEISKSKIMQIANYIITHIENITCPVLNEMLFFSNAIHFTLTDTFLTSDICFLKNEGPEYPIISSLYKKYEYRPINTGIYSTHGKMLSLISKKERQEIDLVLSSFGIFSKKTLNQIYQLQKTVIEKQCDERMMIDDILLKKYYIKENLMSQKTIINYILKKTRILDS